MEIRTHKINTRFLTFLSFCFLALYSLTMTGQWAMPYATGQGAGYSALDNHDTFEGYVLGDSLYTFGHQALGAWPNIGFEYYLDSYGLKYGHWGSSKPVYQWSGTPTSSRKVQYFIRYANGYIVNKWSPSLTDSIRFIRSLDGSLARVDTGLKTLIRTTQKVDSTVSFLFQSQNKNLVLQNWNTGDTIAEFSFNSLSSDYQGMLNPNAWNIPAYHNDGEFIYLQVAEPSLILSYGYDILKLSISTGRLADYHNFKQLGPAFSNSQKFSILVEDTIIDQNNQFISYKSIYDGDWNRLRTFSYLADKFYGNYTGSSPVYFSDSIIIFSTLISDSRVPANNQVIGSHIQVYDNIRGLWLGNSRFQGALGGDNFDIRKVFAVHGGYIYLATQTDFGSSDRDLLVCLPLDLNYNNPLFLRTLGEKELKTGNLELYPNPVNDQLRLDFDRSFTELHFYNMAGRFVGKIPYSEEDNYSTSFLSPGIYSVAIVDGGNVLAERKLIKKLD